MKLSWGLRRRVTSGRTAVVILLPAAVALLSGCWELAVPMIGVGTVGGGVAIAAAKGSAKQHSSTPLAHQGGDGSTEAVAHSAQLQPRDHESGPVMTDLPASTPPAIHSPVIAAAKGLPRARRRHTLQSSTRAVAQTAKPQLRDHRRGPVMAALPASTPPGDLPATTIVH
jgi:hypothetical protein